GRAARPGDPRGDTCRLGRHRRRARDRAAGFRAPRIPRRRGHDGAGAARAPVWDNDLAATPGTSPLRQLVANRGIRSMISLPLLVEDRAEHVFVLYADEADFFTRGEVRVLE